MADIIVVAVLAAAVFFIVRSQLHKLRSGHCGGGCLGGCAEDQWGGGCPVGCAEEQCGGGCPVGCAEDQCGGDFPGENG